ncbi:hypothetical protein TPHA_0G02100 [Tetrapisispora phaffii CBS 4417]|uniref:Malate dehydrogenase n=1 Tax=Tetrapisispora phaffii (strain ATCC 24235 / CBS 4417 / NBRC 1672 / NRRL Y-8282 / UCD 70-5) TaxID=1071381 RepID=G8BVW8_TETPH|nr:hypothetical protein TPHA_0G02100 [Tetrapisispora phaffii CBS 4417]CCE64046.1 hypothetical protein TPHA_0G02100 [Tetrapisispora phaffii CBS 4417]
MVKVCVLGASGGIGQPLSLLLKLSPYVSTLALYDINDITKGISKDLDHINTNSNCSGANADIANILKDANIVIITAGIPRKPGMTRDDLFKINAKIVKNLTIEYGKYCSANTKLLIISNPVNSLIPVVCETLKLMGKFNSRLVMGITMLDLIRANTFLANLLNENKSKKKNAIVNSKQYNKQLNNNNIMVIGGHSGTTIVPLLINKTLLYNEKEIKELVHQIQFGGDEIVKAKNGKGSATLSMAFAGYFFTNEILKTINFDNEESIYSNENNLPCYVYLPDLPNGKFLQDKLKEITQNSELNIEYFAIPVKLNRKSGDINSIDLSCILKNTLSPNEKEMIKVACEALTKDIKTGEDYIKNNSKL